MQFGNIPSEGDFLDTARLTFVDLEGMPWVELKPASRRNRRYTNDEMRGASKINAIQRQLSNGQLTLEHVEKLEEAARDRAAKFLLVDMGGWIDESGAEVPFSEASAKALMRALPADQFEELMRFAGDEANFRRND